MVDHNGLARLQNGVDFLEAFGKPGVHHMIVDNRLPERILLFVIVERSEEKSPGPGRRREAYALFRN